MGAGTTGFSDAMGWAYVSAFALQFLKSGVSRMVRLLLGFEIGLKLNDGSPETLRQALCVIMYINTQNQITMTP